MPASGTFHTRYAQDIALIETPREWARVLIVLILLLVFPFFGTAYQLDLANQVLLASIGALALMLLTGFAGQISLGHAGLLAAGAYTVGILFREIAAPFYVTLPAAGLVGALLGLIFGLPSLRLRGLYLGISTLGLHFVVIFLGNEYETRRGFSTGVMIDPPTVFGTVLAGGRIWYIVLLVAAAAALLASLNLLRSRTGRAWRALQDREIVAEALGIDVKRAKLSAFVISSVMTSLAGALFAYFRGFVSIDAFSIYLTIQYVAMVIVGGMGSLLGALMGAAFVVLLPYAIQAGAGYLPAQLSNKIFALDYSAFGLVMVLFLLFEPQGLVGIYRRIANYFRLWPFRQTRLGGTGGG